MCKNVFIVFFIKYTYGLFLYELKTLKNTLLPCQKYEKIKIDKSKVVKN